jgi:hypothetical protein
LHPSISGVFALEPAEQNTSPIRLFLINVRQLLQMHFAFVSVFKGTSTAISPPSVFVPTECCDLKILLPLFHRTEGKRRKEALTDRIRRFRADRISNIIAGDAPARLYDDHLVLLHLGNLTMM